MDATATAAVPAARPTCGADGDAPRVTAQGKPARNRRSRRPADAEAANRTAAKAQAEATAVAEIEARHRCRHTRPAALVQRQFPTVRTVR